MRKVFSILLLFAVGLLIAAPLFAGAAANEANLPACCRKNGKHHCMMSMAEKQMLAAGEGSARHWTAPVERCPYCPYAVAGFHLDPFAAPREQGIFAGVVSHPAVAPQTESKRRVSTERTRNKRAPPAFSL